MKRLVCLICGCWLFVSAMAQSSSLRYFNRQNHQPGISIFSTACGQGHKRHTGAAGKRSRQYFIGKGFCEKLFGNKPQRGNK